jgi:hypothetical protein
VNDLVVCMEYVLVVSMYVVVVITREIGRLSVCVCHCELVEPLRVRPVEDVIVW